MTSIFPLPTTRSTDLLVQRRLLAQYQIDQLELLKLQAQISTGRRISRPSEDPHAAGRAFSLQRLLEEKAQAKINLATTESYLNASDSAINGVSGLIAEMRGLAVSSAQTTLSDSQRQANSQQVLRAIQQLTNVGNHQFRGRYLFTGSETTVLPFELANNNVIYHGNENNLRSYADVDFIFENNIPGTEVFGTLSPQVRGNADLNPALTENTRLSELRGGLGISRGSFLISDGTTTKTIDITGAETISDVKRLIEANPPTGRTISVRIGATGLTVDIDDAGGGNLTISETGGGSSAAELGIHSSLGTGVSPIVGGDLNPAVTLTTRLANLLGTRASGVISSSGTNNDVIVEADLNGTANNGITVQYVDDSLLHASLPLVAGNETASYSATAVAARAALKFSGLNNNLLITGNTPGLSLNNVRVDLVDAGAIGNTANVSYNAGTKVLTIGIDTANSTSVQTVLNAINAEGTFTASYDASEPADGGFLAGAPVFASDAAANFGNTGNSGGAAKTLFVNVSVGHSTATQIVTAINGTPAVSALFTARLDDIDTTSAASEGQGVVDVNATGTLSGGSGSVLDQTSGLRIENGGQTYNVDISSARTVEELLNILNTSTANVYAEINAAGTGINVRSKLSGSDFSIGENGGQTATQLGIRSMNVTTPLSELNYRRGVGTIAGADFHIMRSDGVTVAIDVSSAVTVGDVLSQINAAGGLIARLATNGNGIEIQDNAGGAGTLTITKEHLSAAAWDLGLVAINQDTATGSGAPQVVTGRDVNPQEVAGVFNTLIRLKDALETNNLGEIQRASEMLDEDLKRVNFARAELGARQQSLDVLNFRIQDEEVELKNTLSIEIDTDLPEAISNMLARQASLEASLRLTGQVFQLTLLNFL